MDGRKGRIADEEIIQRGCAGWQLRGCRQGEGRRGWVPFGGCIWSGEAACSEQTSDVKNKRPGFPPLHLPLPFLSILTGGDVSSWKPYRIPFWQPELISQVYTGQGLPECVQNIGTEESCQSVLDLCSTQAESGYIRITNTLYVHPMSSIIKKKKRDKNV